MLLYGITELTGKPATGKTTLALHLCKDTRTLYISSTLLHHRNIGYNMLICRFDSLSALTNFLLNDAKPLVQAFGIESIILDGLDAFLYTLDRPRQHSGCIFSISRNLKALAFTFDIRVIVITNHFTGWAIDSFTIFNRYLGLRWSYVANIRYIVSKNQDQTRTISRVGGSEKCKYHFKIDDSGVVFLDFPLENDCIKKEIV
ncbi:hypothetical protein PAEPH01_0766 [Pancytospora epiphaga]|nr:hypothetical protein PAEPH01_0766 [Pancytospora epiphaga]